MDDMYYSIMGWPYLVYLVGITLNFKYVVIFSILVLCILLIV